MNKTHSNLCTHGADLPAESDNKQMNVLENGKSSGGE